MKIVVLTGSPHKRGTSALLADEWIAGAMEVGHSVQRFDCAFLQIGACRGCDYCCAHDGTCVQQDDMQKIMPELLAADFVLFVSPTYYFGISAQLKCVIDRFYAKNSLLMGGKRAALIVTCADTPAATLAAPKAHFDAICSYLGWQNAGVLEGLGLSTREDAEKSAYRQTARVFGRSV